MMTTRDRFSSRGMSTKICKLVHASLQLPRPDEDDDGGRGILLIQLMSIDATLARIYIFFIEAQSTRTRL